jgi:N-acetyl-alpha-D-muramate 1-phosphate uridylyltransferase
MKAMIFAAGLGTRLKPYTESMPKALVPVDGVPMLEILIRHMLANGIHDIIINVHHFAGQVVEFLKQKSNFGANISISHEEDILLETGGGLKKASWFFDDNKPFLVQNVDVISDLDYREMLDMHNKSGAIASLAVSDRETSRYFLFDDTMQLCGWENTKTAEVKMVRREVQNPKRLAFSGIHIIDPMIFNLMHQSGKFSIVDTYLELAASYRISGFEHKPENWVDMGKPEELLKAVNIITRLQSMK